MKRIILNASDPMIEKVDEMQEKLAYKTRTSVVEHALNELHRKLFPNYATPKPSFKLDPLEAEKARLDAKETREQARKDRDFEKRKHIVEFKLGGKVRELDGRWVAEFYKYTGKRRYAQSVPLSMIDESLVRVQYSPSREAVEKLQQEGKTDY